MASSATPSLDPDGDDMGSMRDFNGEDGMMDAEEVPPPPPRPSAKAKAASGKVKKGFRQCRGCCDHKRDYDFALNQNVCMICKRALDCIYIRCKNQGVLKFFQDPLALTGNEHEWRASECS
eukprot:14535931-Alexandrium_andersonii.AAC.1